jgi:methylase of polypeptide subunit release factors
MIDYIWRINGLDVFYTNETNGGGDFFAIEYINAVRDWYPNVDHALEWCSGPGFIGYGLLASKLCKTISFNEMYMPAVEMLERTKQHSKFIDKINIFHGSTLSCIPSNIKFDLVVGNPPHWKDIQSAGRSLNIEPENYKHIPDILVDSDWNSHKQFFKSIKGLLSDNGKILLQENSFGSDPNDFKDMIEEADLKIFFTAKSNLYANKGIYYMEVGHK